MRSFSRIECNTEMFDKYRYAAELILFVNNRLQYVAANGFKCSARFSFVDSDETLSSKSGEKFGSANEIISPTEISVGGKKFW